MLTSTEIGTKIAQARKLKNLSQTGLADKMSITPQAVGKWERGESMPDIITFAKVASVLGVDLNYFGEGLTSVQSADFLQPAAAEDKGLGWNMSGGVWKDADFSGLSGLGEKFSGSDIQGCKFIKSDLSSLKLKGNNLRNNDFSGSDFSGSQVAGSHFEASDCVGCIFTNAVFNATELKKCNFDDSDFSGTAFKASHLNGTSVAGAKWSRTTFLHAGFTDMILDGEMTDCTFEGVKVKHTVFRNLTLRNCFFKYCNLKILQFENCHADNITIAFLKSNAADISSIMLLK